MSHAPHVYSPLFESKPHLLQVHQKAVSVAREAGVNEPSQTSVRAFYEMHVGKYQDKTFRWLAENDMGYATYLLCQAEDEGGNTGPGVMNENKRQLKVRVK